MLEILAYVVLGLLLVALAMDWRQTLEIANHPERWGELNPILGKHPKPASVNVYFSIVCVISMVGTAIGVTFIPAGVPFALALVLFAAVTAFEGFVVWRNKKFGL